MRDIAKKILLICLMSCLVMSLMACGGTENKDNDSNSGSTDTAKVANDYYIDLSDMGMKLTIYLRLEDDGEFMFSNTTKFEVNKSSGTFKEVDGEYMMVYTSVNGEDKDISEGITSSFVVTEDGSLDFSVCEKIHYGSAGARTVSEEDESIILLGHVITEDFEEPDTESAFQTGSYGTDIVEQDGVYYTHVISFFDDETYIHFVSYDMDGQIMYMSETGTYGVSTTQLALELENEERIECEVVDGSNLKVSVLPYAGATERITMDFAKTEVISMVTSYTGTGSVTGTADTFDATVTIYEDGSYKSLADGYTEKGIMAIDSATGYVKQYPDHPETAVRGLSQVATVPSGAIEYSDGVAMLADIRVRTSDSLSRYTCIVSE